MEDRFRYLEGRPCKGITKLTNRLVIGCYLEGWPCCLDDPARNNNSIISSWAWRCYLESLEMLFGDVEMLLGGHGDVTWRAWRCYLEGLEVLPGGLGDVT